MTAAHVSTGVVTKTTTNGTGDYEFPDLKVGTYSVVAEASGFSPARATDINVAVAARVRIDLALQVGSAATTAEVSGVNIALETETSENGQNFSNYQAESLPLVSRNYSDLLALVSGSRQAPTAATTTAVTSLVRQGSYNVNGQRSMFNNFMLDGLDNNAYGESNLGFHNQMSTATSLNNPTGGARSPRDGAALHAPSVAFAILGLRVKTRTRDSVAPEGVQPCRLPVVGF